MTKGFGFLVTSVIDNPTNEVLSNFYKAKQKLN